MNKYYSFIGFFFKLDLQYMKIHLIFRALHIPMIKGKSVHELQSKTLHFIISIFLRIKEYLGNYFPILFSIMKVNCIWINFGAVHFLCLLTKFNFILFMVKLCLHIVKLHSKVIWFIVTQIVYDMVGS